jgi:hypothetical protein
MKPRSSPAVRLLCRWALWSFLWAAGAACAAPADISSVPPATMTSSTVRANLMFILDDSGSMADEFVPDAVGNDNTKACYAYSGHNFIFYDPSTTYTPPVDSTGTAYSDAAFTAVYDDGFTLSGGTKDLTNHANLTSPSITLSTSSSTSVSGPTVCGKNTSSACSTTTGAGTTTNNSTTDGIVTATTTTITKTLGNAPGFTCGGTSNSCTLTTTTVTGVTLTGKPYWTRLVSGATDDCNTASNYTPVYDIATLTAAQKTNYANWYQYYRKRMLMMRTAAGRVFAAIDPTRFRVGFSTISYTGVTDGTDFLNIGDYDAGSGSTSQKSLFFSKLYGNAPNGSTPLRPALDKAGKYFAKKVTGQTTDPMQYSCQRNYTLLSTDGYWNTAAEPSSFVPKRLDGTPVGDQDGTASRPQLDITGAKNSLADIAKYYYDVDLRTTAFGNCTGAVSGQNVCINKNPKPGDTSPLQQNMTTYTLGLGVPGVLNYQSNYDTAASGDYHDIVAGTKNWPDPLSSTAAGGLANTGNTVTARIDDLWHAAVNGGGRYYSARNPDEVVTGLTDALQKINAETGASSSAATSTLRPVAGDDWVFLPSYETKTWIGDIGAYHFQIDNTTGAVSISNTPVWKASATLAAQSSRNVLFFRRHRHVQADVVHLRQPPRLAAEQLQQPVRDGRVQAVAVRDADVDGARPRDGRQRGRLPARQQAVRDVAACRRRPGVPLTPEQQRHVDAAGRRDQRRAGLRARAALQVRRHRVFRVQGCPGLARSHGLRRRERRHAACVPGLGRPRDVGLHPHDGDDQSLQPGRQGLRQLAPLLRRRQPGGGRRVRRVGLAHHPGGRPECRRAGLLRARRDRPGQPEGTLGIQRQRHGPELRRSGHREEQGGHLDRRPDLGLQQHDG